MGILNKIIGEGIKDVSDGVGNILDKVITTQAEKDAAKLEIEKEINRAKEAIESKASEVEQAYLADVQSARTEHSAVQSSDKASWLAKNIAPVLALTISAAFFGLLYYMTQYTIPVENKDIVYITVGSLGTAWASIVAFYFGSSIGAQRSGDAMRNMLSKK